MFCNFSFMSMVDLILLSVYQKKWWNQLVCKLFSYKIQSHLDKTNLNFTDRLVPGFG